MLFHFTRGVFDATWIVVEKTFIVINQKIMVEHVCGDTLLKDRQVARVVGQARQLGFRRPYIRGPSGLCWCEKKTFFRLAESFIYLHRMIPIDNCKGKYQ
jgi:hypothetical protein